MNKNNGTSRAGDCQSRQDIDKDQASWSQNAYTHLQHAPPKYKYFPQRQQKDKKYFRVPSAIHFDPSSREKIAFYEGFRT